MKKIILLVVMIGGMMLFFALLLRFEQQNKGEEAHKTSILAQGASPAPYAEKEVVEEEKKINREKVISLVFLAIAAICAAGAAGMLLFVGAILNFFAQIVAYMIRGGPPSP